MENPSQGASGPGISRCRFLNGFPVMRNSVEGLQLQGLLTPAGRVSMTLCC